MFDSLTRRRMCDRCSGYLGHRQIQCLRPAPWDVTVPNGVTVSFCEDHKNKALAMDPAIMVTHVGDVQPDDDGPRLGSIRLVRA